MKDYVIERVLQVADLMISEDQTVRAIADKIKMSKSTVHRDIIVNLKRVDPELHTKALSVLANHKETRHMKGGQALREKRLRQHK